MGHHVPQYEFSKHFEWWTVACKEGGLCQSFVNDQISVEAVAVCSSIDGKISGKRVHQQHCHQTVPYSTEYFEYECMQLIVCTVCYFYAVAICGG